ncbi:MAG: M48 family metallopeptidase [Catalinimonas sp.]
MRQLRNATLLALTMLMSLTACKKVPITGRRQLNLLPSSQMLSLSQSNYSSFLQQNNVVNTGNSNEAQMVKNVGNRLRIAAERFLAAEGHPELTKDFQWEFNLVQDETVNAWCMPGGKVVIYTGILPVTQNEAGLATVMGHEIAHAIARHGNERMSQGLVTQFGGMALQVALASEPQQTQQLFYTAYGLGSQVGVQLPFSRKHESEADRLGVIFMTLAGYDPNQAVPFWQRMSQLGGQRPPEFLSTHPSPDTRATKLRNRYIPEALRYKQKHMDLVVAN